jgi:hypothetical protein
VGQRLRDEGGSEIDQSTLCMHENVIMEPIILYN